MRVRILLSDSKPASSTYKELLEVMAYAMTRLDLVWRREAQEIYHCTFNK